MLSGIKTWQQAQETQAASSDSNLSTAAALLYLGQYRRSQRLLESLPESRENTRLLGLNFLKETRYKDLLQLMAGTTLSEQPEIFFLWYSQTENYRWLDEHLGQGDIPFWSRYWHAWQARLNHQPAHAMEIVHQLNQEQSDDSQKLRLSLLEARLLYDHMQYNSARKRLLALIESGNINGDLLNLYAMILIRSGEIQAGIEVFHHVVGNIPYNELAHHHLGNGYSRYNYSQLQKRSPELFLEEEDRFRLNDIREKRNQGDHTEAISQLYELHRDNPEWVEPLVYLGAMQWEQGDYDRAIVFFQQALLVCPDFGLAHNGLARSIDAKLARYQVFREADEQKFTDRSQPEIPEIEQYVINWETLSSRHRKQVAITVSHWKRYLPALIAGRATCYIKPLYERLSETPGNERLADERNEYDARLWDDTRGVGGQHMVIGLEDVERGVRQEFNTLLHELSHQVHHILPASDRSRIHQLFLSSKKEHQVNHSRFVSNFQQASVQEYFTDGVVALHHPQRDRYDYRDLTRERLLAFDPQLAKLVLELEEKQDVESVFAISIIRDFERHLENNELHEAEECIFRALDLGREEYSVLLANIRFYSIIGDVPHALKAAVRLLSEYSRLSESWILMDLVQFLLSGHHQDGLLFLEDGQKLLTGTQLLEVLLQTAKAYRFEGELDAAEKCARTLLSYQSDHWEACWMIGLIESDRSNWDQANFWLQKAFALRTGIPDLRLDLALSLTMSGDRESARMHLNEAELLHPGRSTLAYIQGLVAREQGRPEVAIEALRLALDRWAFHDDARILLARLLQERGDAAEAGDMAEEMRQRLAKGGIPYYKYHPFHRNFQLVNTWPARRRQGLHQLCEQINHGSYP